MQRPMEMLQGLLELVLIPIVSFALMSWWAVGDAFSSVNGRDQMFSVPFPAENAWALGIVGIGGLMLEVLLLRRRRASLRFHREIAAVVTAGLAGVGLGLALRIVTAKVHGANIGGGMTILFGPWLLLLLVGVSVWLAARSTDIRRQRRSEGS